MVAPSLSEVEGPGIIQGCLASLRSNDENQSTLCSARNAGRRKVARANDGWILGRFRGACPLNLSAFYLVERVESNIFQTDDRGQYCAICAWPHRFLSVLRGFSGVCILNAEREASSLLSLTFAVDFRTPRYELSGSDSLNGNPNFPTVQIIYYSVETVGICVSFTRARVA